MATIISRWEFRTFGERFGSAEAVFAGMTSTGSTDSDELYLLSTAGANVKVRDDLLDIKVLEETDTDGLERWIPVMKAEFPLSAEDAVSVFSALGVSAPHQAHDGYSLNELLNVLAKAESGVRTANVRKHRVRFVIRSCTAELTDVVVDGRSTRTIAVESADRTAVLAAVHDLGLDGYLNVNYQVGVARVLDDVPARYAAIDVGTNSIKFHLGEQTKDGSWRTVTDRADVTRLGEGLETNGAISPQALERTTVAIEHMVDEAARQDALAIVAVGTAGMRIAKNQSDVIAEIRARTGITIEVISGEEESRLAFVAVQAGLGLADGSLLVFDTGGGSSQFTFGRGAHVDERFSVNVGAVSYTEQFGLGDAVTTQTLTDVVAAIATDLSSIQDRPAPEAMVGMGGAITNITAVSHHMATYDPDVVQGTILHRDEIERQIELYRSLDTAGRRSVVGLQPKRADVILAGACIVRTVMDTLNQESLTVSDRGLRHGITIERFGALYPPVLAKQRQDLTSTQRCDRNKLA